MTWKSGEAVGTFLRRIGAGAGLLELEARQVVAGAARRAQPRPQRRIGQPPAGRRAPPAGSSTRSTTLDADGRLADQPYVVRLVAAARRETPEASLAELAERLEIHRSAVQRALERIERLATTDAEAGPRRPARHALA